ncbi:DNA topoisomerase I [Photobacterium angustum]|uniref:nuclease-related domain-containing protein n=1 Tax=Photobacterium angustum TaxID=661 RepID=UPI0005E3E531|nr:nuclease-related domain-containing protein [Photobacterium angustum]KJG05949.1 DNA topoisomerase I [Photobacterium angustum]PSV92557.1 NERD domain-containing protein [Photobacterium angustum]
MDMTSIIFNALQPLCWIIPVVFILFLVRSPWFKGRAGELIVHYRLKLLPAKHYKVLTNVTLPNENGTTQIDHLVVSQYGIFVVETINIKGWIFGGTYQPIWQQALFNRSSVFKNPLHQNEKHIKTLQYLLGVDETAFHSAVVFVGDCTFKTEMPDNVVKSVSAMMHYIHTFKTPLFTELQLQQWVASIEGTSFNPDHCN